MSSLLCIIGSRSLRSYEQGLLFISFARASTRQNRAVSVVCPSTWNGIVFLNLFSAAHEREHSVALPRNDVPLEIRVSPRAFFSHLKTVLFSRAGVVSAPAEIS